MIFSWSFTARAYLCLDSDQAGNDACSRLVEILGSRKVKDFVGRGGAREQAQFLPQAETELSGLCDDEPEGLTVHRLIPLFKDWNEVQTRRGEITDGKELASEEIVKAAAQAGISERTVQNAKPDLVKTIGGTTFDIHIHFSETSREIFTDKVVRLIQNDSNAVTD